MSVHARAAAGALALVFLAACNDAEPRTQALAPTAVEPSSSAMAPQAAPNLAVAIGKQVASICKAYRKAGVQAKADLAKNPGDAELQAQVKALDEMIDDACN
jgi:hypothetical protein